MSESVESESVKSESVVSFLYVRSQNWCRFEHFQFMLGLELKLESGVSGVGVGGVVPFC